MLIERTLFGIEDKVATAIDRLRFHEPERGYWLAFSGGKDSVCILHLARAARVSFDAHYQMTGVDPPELVLFIRREYPEVEWHRPEKTMWQLIAENGFPPLRSARYCCRWLKERYPGMDSRLVVTGVRCSESIKRRRRRLIETCTRYSSRTLLHPIIDWTDSDVWAYIKANNIPYCSLYDEGFKRLGCVMCPCAGKRMRTDAERWPKIAAAYRRACQAAFDRRLARGDKMKWKSGLDMYNWWLSGTRSQDDELSLFGNG